MKKTLLAIASVMMLCVTGCDKDSSGKVSPEDYPSGIVGWWELVSSNPADPDLGDGYRWVMEFKDNGLQTHFDNIAYDYENDRLIFDNTLHQIQPYYDYWIEEDILCGKDMDDDCCTEFGYPNCECNLDGDSHYTKIRELSKKTLVIEMCDRDDKATLTFERINKPSNIRYK